MKPDPRIVLSQWIAKGAVVVMMSAGCMLSVKY